MRLLYKGILNIALHFVAEFLHNDVASQVRHCCGGLCAQIASPRCKQTIGNEAIGRARVCEQVPAGRLPDWTLPSLVAAFLTQMEGMMAAHPLWHQEHNVASSYAEGGPLAEASDALCAWEASLDELEDFVFRRIASALLPALPAPLALPCADAEDDDADAEDDAEIAADGKVRQEVDLPAEEDPHASVGAAEAGAMP